MRFRYRTLLFYLLNLMIILDCGAILNLNGDDDNRNIICDTGVCKCTSFGAITVTCSCEGSTMQELEFKGDYRVHPNTMVLRVENCPRVVISSYMLEGLKSLRRVELASIPNVTVEEHGFAWKLNESLLQTPFPVDGITITIENSTLPHIPSYAFQGRLYKIAMNKAQIGNVGAYAFTDLYGTDTIEFIDSNFTNWEAQAFKKFSVEFFTLTRGNYGSLPSRWMVDIEVRTSLLIDQITVEQIRSSALIVTRPESFKILGCKITRIEGEAFRVVTRGPTVISNNAFLSLGAGAFAGITVEKYLFSTEKHQKLTFSSNNITHFEANSLVFNTSRLTPKLDKVSIDQSCKCELIETWFLQLTIFPPAYIRSVANPQASPDLWCRWDERGRANNQFIEFHEYQKQYCGVITSNMHILIIIIISSAALLLAIGIVIICICRKRRSQSQRWTNVSTSNTDCEESQQHEGRKKQRGVDSRITMVVPDGRMYRETELQVIVEQAEPINDQPIYQNIRPKPLPRNMPK